MGGGTITESLTLYIRNSVWYWYESAEDSIVHSQNYSFYTDPDHKVPVRKDLSDVYESAIASTKKWVWLFDSVTTIDRKNLYYQDIEARMITTSGIYPNDAKREHDSIKFLHSYRLAANTAFYVDWNSTGKAGDDIAYDGTIDD